MVCYFLGKQQSNYIFYRYHHTTCSNLLYALREALAQLSEERLCQVQKRHQDCARQFYAGLEKLGLEFFVEDSAKRLPSVTTIKVSESWCWREVVAYAMKK